MRGFDGEDEKNQNNSGRELSNLLSGEGSKSEYTAQQSRELASVSFFNGSQTKEESSLQDVYTSFISIGAKYHHELKSIQNQFKATASLLRKKSHTYKKIVVVVVDIAQYNSVVCDTILSEGYKNLETKLLSAAEEGVESDSEIIDPLKKWKDLGLTCFDTSEDSREEIISQLREVGQDWIREYRSCVETQLRTTGLEVEFVSVYDLLNCEEYNRFYLEGLRFLKDKEKEDDKKSSSDVNMGRVSGGESSLFVDYAQRLNNSCNKYLMSSKNKVGKDSFLNALDKVSEKLAWRNCKDYIIGECALVIALNRAGFFGANGVISYPRRANSAIYYVVQQGRENNTMYEYVNVEKELSSYALGRKNIARKEPSKNGVDRLGYNSYNQLGTVLYQLNTSLSLHICAGDDDSVLNIRKIELLLILNDMYKLLIPSGRCVRSVFDGLGGDISLEAKAGILFWLTEKLVVSDDEKTLIKMAIYEFVPSVEEGADSGICFLEGLVSQVKDILEQVEQGNNGNTGKDQWEPMAAFFLMYKRNHFRNHFSSSSRDERSLNLENTAVAIGKKVEDLFDRVSEKMFCKSDCTTFAPTASVRDTAARVTCL